MSEKSDDGGKWGRVEIAPGNSGRHNTGTPPIVEPITDLSWWKKAMTFEEKFRGFRTEKNRIETFF
jgi:hypothetical protein